MPRLFSSAILTASSDEIRIVLMPGWGSRRAAGAGVPGGVVAGGCVAAGPRLGHLPLSESEHPTAGSGQDPQQGACPGEA